MVTFDADCQHAQPGPTATFEDKELKILAQDRVLLESARRWIDRGREEFQKSVVSDFPQLLARRLHQAAINGKLDEFHLDKPRVFEMRG